MKPAGGPRFEDPCALEPLEPRLLLAAGPDLAVSFGPNLPQVILPGDKLKVPVILTNVGAEPASGGAQLQLWLSEDQVVGEDYAAGQMAIRGGLEPGASATFWFKMTVPPSAQPGDHWFLAKLDHEGEAGDGNAGNDTAFAPAPSQVIWQFGTFDDGNSLRKNFKLTVHGQDLGQGAVLTSFSLSGGGYGKIVGGDSFDALSLYETSEKSSLTIASAGNLDVSVGSVSVRGPLKNLTAKTTDLRDSMWVEGGLAKLILGDVDRGHTIAMNLNGTADPKLTCQIRLGRARYCDIETNGVPVKALSVEEWLGGGQIEAPWLASLSTRGSKQGARGDFEASLRLSGAGNPGATLGSVKVAGDLNDVAWKITGQVGTVAIAGGVYWSRIRVQSRVKSFQAAEFIDSELEVDGAVGSFAVDHWADSDLEADSLGKLAAGHFRRGQLTLNGSNVPAGKLTLGSARVGDVSDSLVPDGRGWTIRGGVGSLAIGDTDVWDLVVDGELKSIKMGLARHAAIDVADVIGTVQALEWYGGALNADAISSVKIAGDLGEMSMSLGGQDVAPGGLALGSLLVGGTLENLRADVAGNVGKVSAAALRYANLLIGCTRFPLVGDASDFDDGEGGTNQHFLKSLAIKGTSDNPADPLMYFEGSVVAAWQIGSFGFSRRPASASGEVEVHDLGKLRNEPDQLGTPTDPFKVVWV